MMIELKHFVEVKDIQVNNNNTYSLYFIDDIYNIIYFLAPEILRGESYSYSVDWFSLGVILYEMISGVVC